MRVKPSQGSQFCWIGSDLHDFQIVEVTASANGAGEPQAQRPNSLFQYQVFMRESAFLRLDKVKSQLEEEKRLAISLQKYSEGPSDAQP